MAKLKPTLILPTTSRLGPSKIKDPALKKFAEDVTEVLKRIIHTIDELNRASAASDNIVIVLETAELIAPGNVAGQNGNWRFAISGVNLEVEKKESGSWVQKWTFEPST